MICQLKDVSCCLFKFCKFSLSQTVICYYFFMAVYPGWPFLVYGGPLIFYEKFTLHYFAWDPCKKDNADLIRLSAALYISYDTATLEQNSLKSSIFKFVIFLPSFSFFFWFFSVSFVHWKFARSVLYFVLN